MLNFERTNYRKILVIHIKKEFDDKKDNNERNAIRTLVVGQFRDIINKWVGKYFRQENSEVLENVLFLPLATTDVNKELDKKYKYCSAKLLYSIKL